MSFWNLSDGETAADTPKEYDGGGGNFAPIPNDSSVLAIIEEAKWTTAENNGDPRDFITAKWSIMAPEQFKNRKVFQKLWVSDFDPNAKDETKAKTKRDKARKMLAGIDANAGGNLTRSNEAPSDDSMAMHLTNKPMVIKLMIWSMPSNTGGDPMEGNWIAAVSPADKPLAVGADSRPAPSAAPASRVLDDDIPF